MRFTQGNLLEAPVEAVVNTVNTVGVMGKGIALMFKERFPENFKKYAAACAAGQVRVGEMFVTSGVELGGPRWIINFPTKQHWRQPTKLEWVRDGLAALKEVIRAKGIKSIALPPLGCGNGGLNWAVVRPVIEQALGDLTGVEVIVYEPTAKYQNVVKKQGVEKLTPARALIAEMIRRYWVLGIECTLLEAQKLAWFLERTIQRMGLKDPLDLRFEANRYGPYANRLTHLLNGLDGSYLHCDKRMADADPFDTIWFEDIKREKLEIYLRSPEAKDYLPALVATDALIDGFQSPLGMEALATVDWLLVREGAEPSLAGIREGIRHWPAGEAHAQRKEKLFHDRLLELALQRLQGLGGAA
ncbi:MAG TPA: macro domain-containing protein [Candidatus Paceibacterota bacterium]|nr:macro domain-containing protein [Verrucomicrobiota bacterium]HOX03629.1 macro domain-containing protein [Verrucomicrobiota bacterium]HRZ46565.1 macro domain-containing protein [Candidatus Paceibacterota bacterium]HRZ91379.1 macro domain-containing protein [Candidatus Paceibacterota bacterium]